MFIQETTLFTDPFQVMGLNIINFRKPNGFWSNPGDALKTVSNWLVDRAVFTEVYIYDFEDAPPRDDFPNWKHQGTIHVPVGRKLWNWFYWKFPYSKLDLADSPDFYGWFPKEEGFDNQRFWGDIGKVSVSAFALTQKRMMSGDLWISVLDEGHRQVIIESLTDNHTEYMDYFLGTLQDESKRTTKRAIQLTLF